MSSLAIELSSNRAGGVYRLIAGTTARMQSGPCEVKVLMGIEQDAAGAAEGATRETWNRSCITE